MTELRFEGYTMPAADLGPLNPLPDLAGQPDAHANIQIDPSVTAEEAQYMGFGRIPGILPYMLQDGYNRVKKPRTFQAAVLENEHLVATFLPELGGRLWSLIDKHENRELLHRNPVFQPANLALRNAWISGGVEWNIGMTGHHPYTVSPLFAAKTVLSDGTPVLRMYEWERVRQAAYCLEAYLPEGSRFLLVRMRIYNTQDREIPMYWWSNMAADERETVRVLVPADKAFRFGYGGKIAKVDVPYVGDEDVSHSTQIRNSVDYFFDVPKGQRKWIAALENDGKGIVQTSTSRLIGRKLFVWGQGPGGKRWQSFLAKEGCAYIEIQSGLAHTQMECLPMPAVTCWDWLEAYGKMEADPAVTHGEDWDAAWKNVDAHLEEMLPNAFLESELLRLRQELDGKDAQVVSRGGGWAELEQRRLAKEGKTMPIGALDYSGSMGAEQAPWLALLEEGALPCPSPDEAPVSYMVGPVWRKLLEASVASGASSHWYGYLHLGIMRFYEGDVQGAVEAWKASLEKAPSCWALRNLAAACRLEKDTQGAADYLVQAMAVKNDVERLAVECAKALLEAGRPQELIEVMEKAPAWIRGRGRVRFLLTSAYLEVGRVDEVIAALEEGIEVDDMREGEVTLTDLWCKAQCMRISRQEGIPNDEALRARVEKEVPPPAHIDFRMKIQ